ncbi:MAG: c-type cytochrome [Rhodobacteraceae bacterium]|nr:c-type cytochrome [Paracoccaceae bacterium]
MLKYPSLPASAVGRVALIAGGACALAALEYNAGLAEAAMDAGRIPQARLAPAAAGPVAAPVPRFGGPLGIGRPALEEEIAAWDVDILPDGRGLPPGKGAVFTGETIFADKCASCHGDFGEGVDNWPVLAGGFDTLADEDPVKTVGSYWPHLSTVWDYISRSMPFGEAGTLTADETYAIVAYILYSNDMVDGDFVLSHENLADFEMYNRNGFVIDDRAVLEYGDWRADPCMSGCKETVEVTMRSVFLVNTPEEGGSESVMNRATIEGLPVFSANGPSFIPDARPGTGAVAAAATEESGEESTEDKADRLARDGERVFRKCRACHRVGPGAGNASGPHLNGLMGRVMGSVEGFNYSGGFRAAREQGRVWDETSLEAFLTSPGEFMKGTKMSFSGLGKKGEQEAIRAYLGRFREE